MPWWGIMLIALGAAVAGGLVMYVVVMLIIGKGFRRSF